ncbi:MAG: DUF1579 domain-containing protein [Phycisphaerae bacterium]
MLSRIFRGGVLAVFACCAVSASLAQDKKPEHPKAPEAKKPELPKPADAKAAAGQGADDAMKKMMEACEKAGALGDQHKQLGYMVGDWTYVNKMWMDPSAPPMESTGTCTTKAIWDGRYYHSDHSGKMMMPDATGKMTEKQFMGTAITGYDNMKQKFVSCWIDNMGTGIMMSEGTYDPATKAYTYISDMDDPMMPGTKVKVREVIKVLDKDKHTLEWYETREGKEMKTMEITYTRKGAA